MRWKNIMEIVVPLNISVTYRDKPMCYKGLTRESLVYSRYEIITASDFFNQNNSATAKTYYQKLKLQTSISL